MDSKQVEELAVVGAVHALDSLDHTRAEIVAFIKKHKGQVVEVVHTAKKRRGGKPRKVKKAPKASKGRKPMSARQKAQIRRKLKAYWAEKKAQKGKE